ncbi:MAG: hypothetical protein ACYSTS_18880 [Planctomycetota bacterium]
MKNTLVFMLVIIVALGLSTTVKAELIPRGRDNLKNNLVYDTVLDITWYDYSYVAYEYQDAVAWADQLSVKIGTTEFTDWRLPSVIKGENYNQDSPHHTEIGHLYLKELVENAVMHPWAFPDNWRDFDRLVGGYYWMLQIQDRNSMGSEVSSEALVYNSKDRNLQFIPVLSVKRPRDSWYKFFSKKKKYLGVAVHPGDIVRK